jgi:hypothetical protein
MPAIFLETDLESDDLLAIYLLAKRGYYPSVIVVGEGDATIKVARMHSYMRLLKFENLIPQGHQWIIIQGYSSKKLFPQDGAEFDLTSINELKTKGLPHQTHYVTALQSYIANHQDPIYIGLKPPRELMQYHSQLTAEIAKLRGYMYGSFNFRSVWVQLKELSELLPRFKSMHIYESFYATGSLNSMDPDWCPQTWKQLFHDKSPFLKTVNLVVSNWNSHMKNDCLKTCMTIAKRYTLEDTLSVVTETNSIKEVLVDNGVAQKDIDQYMRNLKVLRSVVANPDTQMVMADIGVALAVDNHFWDSYATQGEISFDSSGYTQIKASNDPSCHVYLYQNIPTDIYDPLIASYLKL